MNVKQQSTGSLLSLLLLTTTLVACSDSGSSNPISSASNTISGQTDSGTTADGQPIDTDASNDNNNSSDDNTAQTTTGVTTADPETDVVTDADTTSSTDTSDTDDGTTTTTGEPTPEPITDSPGSEQTTEGDTTTDNPVTEPPNGEDQPETDTDPVNPGDIVPPQVTGGDDIENDDDSPTETESASLVGPFIKDASRPAGPPSAPEGLTPLMAGEDFVEFSWKPSTDDQSVEQYEIYRDGNLVYTIEYNNTFEFNYRNWISTSYIDCNYTRFTGCDANPIVPGSSYQYQVAAIDNEGMRSELSQPATFQLAQRQSGGADLSGYVQVLNEEFDGDSLDRELWKTSLPWGPDQVINREQQYFVNLFGSDPINANPFVFTGTTLQITGTVTPPELLAAANNQPYLSGVISTKDKFQMTYGYVEMKAKLTSGKGFLSTFYLFNQSFLKNKPEIDIIEYIGDRPDKAYQTYHYHDSNRARTTDGERHSTPTMESQLGFDLSADYHTYGVLWEPELVAWYIDGVEVRRLTGVRVSDEPMNIIAQLVVGSEWIGEPDASSLPKALEIDYIKAWQKQ